MCLRCDRGDGSKLWKLLFSLGKLIIAFRLGLSNGIRIAKVVDEKVSYHQGNARMLTSQVYLRRNLENRVTAIANPQSQLHIEDFDRRIRGYEKIWIKTGPL